MKLSEFEERLATVSDRKLRLMLDDCRRKGPEVAVKLILAEAGRRGLDLEAAPADSPSRPAGDLAFADEAGAGDPAFAEAAGMAADGAEAAHSGESVSDGAPKGAWLAEEQSEGMPMFLKILLTVAVLGGILAALIMILGKDG